VSGQDAAFLALETPSNHMQVAAMAVLDPATVPGGYSFAKVRDRVRHRLRLAAPLRRRLVEVPLGLGHPVWVEDPDFDLDDHVRRVALPSPGGDAELRELVGEAMSRPLDRRRPLWELHVVEGLEHGRLAFLLKVHHAVTDGVSGAELGARLLDLEPEPGGPAGDGSNERDGADRADGGDGGDDPWRPEAIPSDLELLAAALSSLPDDAPAIVAATRRTLEASRLGRANHGGASLGLFRAPRSSLSATISPLRNVAFVRFGLDELNRLKAALGGSITDVVLALVAGALRSHLAGRGETVEEDLVAMVPVSTHGLATEVSQANSLSRALVSLATTVEDPVERFGRIHDGLSRAKSDDHAGTADLLAAWAELARPAVAGPAARLVSRLRLMEWGRPPFNVTVSSVPGPPFPLYFAGARLDAVYPMGPVVDGAALNVTALSYLDQLHVGLVADRKAVADLDGIAAGMRLALDELTEASKRVPGG